VEKFGPNPTQPNTTNNVGYSFSSDVFLYTELIGFGSGQIGRKISVSVTAKSAKKRDCNFSVKVLNFKIKFTGHFLKPVKFASLKNV